MAHPRRVSRGSLSKEDGVAAVEFAIIMTLLFIVVFGIVEFGVAFSKLNVYTGAAREGARYAAVRCSPDSTTGCTNDLIASRVNASAVGYPVGPGSPSADTVCSASNIGAPVTVSWSQNITVDIPFLPGMSPITYTRLVKGVFRCE
jgi:Flp pilus assembly protein TadG